MRPRLLIPTLAFAGLTATAASAPSLNVLGLSSERTAKPLLERARLSQRSLYQLTSRWTSEQGRQIELIEFGGNFVVIAMIFTSCPSACPTLVRDLQALERSLPPALLAELRFVLISIDPERDTPEVLQQYAEKMGLDARRWTLLRGRAEDVRELGAVLGVAYGKAGAANELVHSKFVTLLDRQGELLEQQLSVRDDPIRVVRALEHALAAEVKP